jgi:radical SAM protein with 4Fe4S-binding SPASM domain
MSMDLFTKIVDEAAGIPEITEVCLTGLSESLLDPDLVHRVAYARSRMPGAFLNCYTNGTYLTLRRYEELQAAGLDMVLISLNAADAETRKRVMGLDDWDTVMANISAAIHAEKTCRVMIRAVTNLDSFTYPQTEPLFEMWGDRFLAVREGNWSGDNRSVRQWAPNEACGRALGQIYVTFEGKVTPCCFDPFGKKQMGDLNTQSLREVYNSEPYRTFREDHFGDQADKHEICRNCTRI